MNEISNNITASREISKHSVNTVLKEWEDQGGADIAEFINGTITIERSTSGEDLPPGLADCHDVGEVEGIVVREARILLSWFKVFDTMKKLVRVSFESCKLPTPNQKVSLPSQVTQLSIRSIEPEQISGILSQGKETLEKLSIKEFVFNEKVFKTLKSMNNLKELRLIGTNPLGGLGEQPHLESICLSQLALNDAFKDWVYNLKDLKKVELLGTRFDKLPENLISDAEELTVSLSEIRELPECPKLKLKKLTVSNVAISKLPDCYLTSGLTHLDLSQTQIISLPGKIAKLKKLEYLNISDTKIEELPKSMSMECIANLKHLNLSRTNLKNLPEWIGKCNNLQFIGLAGCHLNNIDGSIIQLLLKLMSTSSQQASVDKGDQIKVASIDGLIVKTIDTRLLRLPHAKEVFEYYLESQRKPAHEIRLYVLGDRKGDRVSVMQHLLDEPEIIQESLISDGISLLEVDFASLGEAQKGNKFLRLESDAQIHLYEMDENDVYQSAHSMFFSDQSLYLVVLNADLGSRLLDKARYWANIVEFYAPNSSLIFCILDNDNTMVYNPEFIRQNLQMDQSPSICNIRFHDDDAVLSQESIQELKWMLIQAVKFMPAYTWEIPLAWIKIKNHIGNLMKARPVISWKQFKHICRYYHDEKVSEGTLSILLAPLVKWMDETGVCFIPSDKSQKDELPTNLYDFVWLAECTYGVLRYAKKLHGEATTKAIWQAAETADDDNFLATRFINRSKHVMQEMLRAGICLKMEQEDSSSLYLYPLFKNTAYISEPISKRGHALDNKKEKEGAEWLNIATAPISVTKIHYKIHCSVISEAFLSAFLLKTYEGYRDWIKEFAGSSFDLFSYIGRDGLLVAFPPKDATGYDSEDKDAPRSGSLFVTGLVGCPADLHIHASGIICPLLPGKEKWEKARSHHVLDYASIALKSLYEIMQEQSALQPPFKKFTVFVKDELGIDKTWIPLEDIKIYREMKRLDYYCAPLNKTLDVKRAYQIYYPAFLRPNSL